MIIQEYFNSDTIEHYMCHAILLLVNGHSKDVAKIQNSLYATESISSFKCLRTSVILFISERLVAPLLLSCASVIAVFHNEIPNRFSVKKLQEMDAQTCT